MLNDDSMDIDDFMAVFADISDNIWESAYSDMDITDSVYELFEFCQQFLIDNKWRKNNGRT